MAIDTTKQVLKLKAELVVRSGNSGRRAVSWIFFHSDVFYYFISNKLNYHLGIVGVFMSSQKSNCFINFFSRLRQLRFSEVRPATI